MTQPNETQRIELGDFHFFLTSRWKRSEQSDSAAGPWVDSIGPNELVTAAELIPRDAGELGMCVRKYAVGRASHAVKNADSTAAKMGTPWFEEREHRASASCSAFLGDGHIFVAVVGKPADGDRYAVLSIVIVRGDADDTKGEAGALLTDILESVDVVPS